MRLTNLLVVLRQLGTSFVKISGDALLPGRALPLSDERVAQPDFLNRLLRQYGLADYQHLPAISKAQLLATQSISSNCNNRVMALEYEGDHVGLPASMFLKMPVTDLTARFFFNVIMCWRLECEFYRNVAPRLSIRTPQIYAAANQGSRFIMLMENLHDDPSVVLHTNPQMVQGTSLATARRCLQTLASIHAEFHGISKAEQERLLPTALQPFTSPVMRAISPLMGKVALANCLKQGQLELSTEHIAWYHKAIAHWDELVDWWTQGPLTLVHGDSHLGNHFLYGDKAGMLDWQAAQWGKGIRDVQYFLTDSLPADVLADNEKELVKYYLDALADNGVQLDFSETWYQYRGFSFQTWMTIVVSMGFGAMTDDMDAVMPEIHRRCIASIERLELGKWLDEVIEQ
jgi:aminoglycoside/choline kinase family phosphotransferase